MIKKNLCDEKTKGRVREGEAGRNKPKKNQRKNVEGVKIVRR